MLTVLNILCLQGKCAGIYIKQNHFVNGKAHWKQKTDHKTKFYIWHNANFDNWRIGEDKNFLSSSFTFLTQGGTGAWPPYKKPWKIYKDGKWQKTKDVQVSSGNFKGINLFLKHK